MKTGGAIASILGAMLLGGMGGGMFKGKGKEEDEATQKLPSDDMTKVHFMKNREVETPSPIDATEMVKKQGLNPTFDNINRVTDGMLVDRSKDAPIPGASLSNEQLTGEPMPQAIEIPGLTSDANDTSLPSQPEDGSPAGPKTYQQMIREEAAKPKLPKRPANVPGPRTVQEGYEQEKLYEGSEEPGMLEKFVQSIAMPDRTRNPYYRDPNDTRRWRTSSGDRQMSNGK